MTAEGHLFFSIACAVFAKNAELTPVLAQGDWWHIVPSAVLTCLLPDIDHPKSFLGQRLSWISKPVARAFGHRGFTHSLLAVFGALTLFYLKVPDSWIVPADALRWPGAGLSQPHSRRYAHPRRCAAAVALSLALPAADPCAAQGQSARTRLVYGAVRLCRLDAADAGGQQRDTLVIRGDQFPADHLQSLYKSPEWAIKRRKTPFGYNPFHLNISP